MKDNDIELKEIVLNTPVQTYSDIISTGPVILPQNRIKLYDDTEWEQFTEECGYSLKDTYKKVRRTGGAGDEGIDIVAFKTNEDFGGAWDNYQCKHYNHPLRPTDIYVELGKLCYYTFIESYSVPDKYYLVAPQGVGTSLGKLVRGNHSELKRLLIQEWGKYCEGKITTKKKISLTGDLRNHVDSFDFSIVEDISILELLNIHRQTPFYPSRFGGGLPSRPENEKPPEEIAEIEAIYIQKLLDAYAEFLERDQCSVDDIDAHAALRRHLRNARVQFYCAESLQKFSRDYLEAGEFERLQESIYTGIENIILFEHPHGYERVKHAVQEAYKIQIDSHPLKERLDVVDRAGICHQLANNNRLSWTNRDQENE